MQEEFINPNFHVILIHYPLGLLVMGTLIELFAFLWRRSGFAAGRWMILLGAMSLAPAAASGLYAMYDVNCTATTLGDATWQEVRAQSPVQGAAWEMMREHAWYAAAGSIAILLLVVIWIAGSDRFRARMHLVFLILLLGGLGAITLGAWHGGEMIFRHGVAVNTGAAVNTHAAEMDGKSQAKREIEYYLPPKQVHVILAGMAIAMGLVAIGLSLRAGAEAKVTGTPMPGLSDINYALNPNLRAMQQPSHAAQLAAMEDFRGRAGPLQRTPVARFWLLGALLAIGTALAGWWILGAGNYDPKELWQTVMQDAEGKEYRRLAHVIAGGGIIVLMVLMAIIARAAPRFIVGLFGLLLIAAVAAQVWLGSLLLFDTSAGLVQRFNSTKVQMPTTAPATHPATTPIATYSPAHGPG